MTNDQFVNEIAPFSQEAEQATIGSCLIDPSQFIVIRAFLSANDFFLLRHKYIWESMCRLDDRKEPIDMIVLAEDLENRGKLDTIGGRMYLVDLTNNTATSVYAEVYAHLVEHTSVRRQLMTVASDIQAEARNEDSKVSDLVDIAQSKLMDIQVGGSSRNMVSVSDAVMRHMDNVEWRQANPNAIIGIPTGYALFDHITRGFQDDRLYIFAGQTGIGKSAWGANLAIKIAKTHSKKTGAKYRVGWFSYENSEQETITRFISIMSGIDAGQIDSGTMNPDDYKRYNDTAGELANLDLLIHEDMTITPMRLRALCRQMKYNGGLDAIFIDYLQLIPSGADFKGNREAEVAYLTTSLKALAKELHVPVITFAQINRENVKRGNKKPQLTDLRESASLEHTADLVGFVHSDDYYGRYSNDPIELEAYNSNIWDSEIIIAKHRNGGTGTCPMKFIRNQTRFLEVIPKPKNESNQPSRPIHYADK